MIEVVLILLAYGALALALWSGGAPWALAPVVVLSLAAIVWRRRLRRVD